MHEARCASINHGYSQIPRKRGTLDHRWTAWEEASTPIESYSNAFSIGSRHPEERDQYFSDFSPRVTAEIAKFDDSMIFNNFEGFTVILARDWTICQVSRRIWNRFVSLQSFVQTVFDEWISPASINYRGIQYFDPTINKHRFLIPFEKGLHLISQLVLSRYFLATNDSRNWGNSGTGGNKVNRNVWPGRVESRWCGRNLFFATLPGGWWKNFESWSMETLDLWNSFCSFPFSWPRLGRWPAAGRPMERPSSHHLWTSAGIGGNEINFYFEKFPSFHRGQLETWLGRGAPWAQ